MNSFNVCGTRIFLETFAADFCAVLMPFRSRELQYNCRYPIVMMTLNLDSDKVVMSSMLLSMFSGKKLSLSNIYSPTQKKVIKTILNK